tara:strand:+ start:3362 stop:6865 length:3504 start_codon:yes stop_codon:yes gene_type:complete
MFLSKLRIQGFKSFPDKTELNFTDGVTSIVGPNGCGKTNIVDAIRWVLGEQKASTLRSNKMEEVIFNGTQKKKPLNFCEATLTIENNKDLLPIEYDTVEITRRYFRNGDSEYYINKNQCRLKDIHEMFIDTGMSSGAYSVIELKMIESILSQNPTDRRTMIDEASGINNYNKQRAASTRRLVSTKSDMERIYDIMSEVGSNVKKLKLQMKRYERHRMLSQDLLSCEKLFNEKSIEILNEKLNPLILSQKEMTNSKNIFIEDLKKKEEGLEKAQEQFEKTRIKMESMQDSIKGIEDSIVKINQDIIIATEQIGHSKNRIEQSDKEIKTKSAQLVAIQNQIKKMNQQIKKLLPTISKKQTSFNEQSKSHKSLNQEFDSVDKCLADIQERYLNILADISVYNNDIATNARLVEEKNILIKSHREEISNTSKGYVESKTSLDEYLKKLSQINKIRDKEIKNIDKNNNLIEDIDAKLLNLNEEKVDLSKEILVHENKLDFFNKLISTKDGSSSGNEFLLDNKKKYGHLYRGKLEDLIDCPKSLLSPLAGVLGRFSDYLVIDKLIDAQEIIESLDQKNMTFNFIVLDQIPKIKKIVISIDSLLAKIKYSPEISSFLYNLIGKYKISDRSSGNSYITLDGNKILSNGILRVNPNKHDSKMYTKNEISSTQKKIDTILNQKLMKIDREINLMINEKKTLSKSNIELKNSLNKNDSISNDVSIKIEKYKFLSQEHQKKQRHLQESILLLEKEIISIGIKSKEAKSNATKRNSDIKKIEEEKNNLIKESHKIKEKILLHRQKIETSKIDLIEITNQQHSIANRIEDYQQNENEINLDLKRYKSDINKLEALIRNLGISNKELKARLKRLYSDEKKINKDIGKLQTRYSNEYQSFQSFQSDIKDKRIITDSNNDKLNEIKIQIEKIKAHRDTHLANLENINNNDVKLDSIDKFINDDANTLSSNMIKIKSSIERIGPINMEVDSQHEAEIERYEFLENQYNDLVESEISLKETIDSLDKEARKLFEATFKEIQQNFSKTYNMFYDGGKASLDLKGDDVLDAEIIIKATPPGKSTQSLRMLSGGEKAITAISLLFAIYLVKPSPFCILDEVDAPLDDVNIKRFNEVIKAFSQNSQFIVVTHNKLTMEASDYLYGVTQQQKGISKIVSVNLNDIDKRLLA